MPNLDLPILVVDDAKFSSAVVARTLKSAGYRDVRIANNADSALAEMEDRAVSVLIADWLMPRMDGLELTDRVRQIDELSGRYTYVILLTGKEHVSALTEAFDRGVDDFINKSDMSKQLLPRVFAADRLADRHNTLLLANRLLVENNRDLESRNYADLETGMANARYARKRLEQSLRHTESRGGATAYLIVGIRNWQEIKRRHNASTLAELAAGIGRRLTHLIRPLDALCRIGENQFAIIAHFAEVEHCQAATYKRIHDGLNHKAFKTTAGYVAVEPGTALCVCGDGDQAPKPETLERAALSALMRSYETRTLVTTSVGGEVEGLPLTAKQ
ncbi:response regulator [Hydrocarboniclastica marina]|uniref:Response regulator n=1 Tax=Hydrocarboniclastica marina TaxID=2259620 RepID=A0A4P7XHD0_9ALTE|nr:response regulator [Hydrocarboniclastica marina]MAM00560.1 diguanylate cyclase [Alteromonadaceae bacterium]QCF26426.1 response regulator [Hydrocarboniclastica marina]